jgi:formyl-CoA transferase
MTATCLPLAGLRSLDLTRLAAGGLLGLLLADFGAEVLNVEQPGTGDPLRQWTTDGQPLWWRVCGRNKRALTLNLQAPVCEQWA